MENNCCKVHNECGGCAYLENEYDKTLSIKKKKVEQLLKNACFSNIRVNNVIGMENPYNYRNKGKFAFGYNQNKKPVMGFFEEGTHRIIPFEDCLIQNDVINEVAKFVFELVKKYKLVIYNEDTKKGFLRHLIVKYGINSRRDNDCFCYN